MSKSGFLLSILFTTDVSIQVNKGMRMIATLAELGCFACDLGEGRTIVMAVLTSSRRHDMTGIILKEEKKKEKNSIKSQVVHPSLGWVKREYLGLDDPQPHNSHRLAIFA